MTTGAERGEIAEVGSPVDVPADPVWDEHEPLRWTSMVIAVAALLLAIFNTSSMTSWLDERQPSAAIDMVRAPLTTWDAMMVNLHLNAPRARMHGWWQAAKAARFGNEHPGEPGAA